jgi:hypothetical protein
MTDRRFGLNGPFLREEVYLGRNTDRSPLGSFDKNTAQANVVYPRKLISIITPPVNPHLLARLNPGFQPPKILG